MIKHGPIQTYYHRSHKDALIKSHLEPISKFVTKGIADATQSITLDLQKCDVKGAKRFDGQKCVIAKALTRVFKPDAVAVGRSRAYVVIKGLAIRFNTASASQKTLEEFDDRGRAHLIPVKLLKVCKSQRLGSKQKTHTDADKPVKRARARKIGVRAAGGGIAT